MSRKVYVPNRSFHDLRAAESFGTLVYLTEGRINPFHVNGLARTIMHEMRDSSPDDFLLISSLTIINAVASAVLTKKHGRLNLLVFNSRTNGYEERTLDLASIEEQA